MRKGNAAFVLVFVLIVVFAFLASGFLLVTYSDIGFGSRDSPEELMETYFRYMDRGDINGMLNLVHEDSETMQQIRDMNGDILEGYDGSSDDSLSMIDITYRRLEVRERETDVDVQGIEELADVLVEYRVSVPLHGRGDRFDETAVMEITLAKEDSGEWYVWDTHPDQPTERTVITGPIRTS